MPRPIGQDPRVRYGNRKDPQDVIGLIGADLPREEPTGTELTSGFYSIYSGGAFKLTTTPAFYTIELSPPITLSANTTYWVRMNLIPNIAVNTDYVEWSANDADPIVVPPSMETPG